MNRPKGLSKKRIEECREDARSILKGFHVKSPDAIDIETFSWHLGRLRIKVGGLTGSEGRLVAAPGEGGVIRVASRRNEGRFRFTAAHEIGHFRLHSTETIDRTVVKRDLGIWHDESEEAEANYFAAELLMPKFLFQSRCVGFPSISLVDSLAQTFRTSLSATIIQYWAYTREPVAVVFSDGNRITSFRPFSGNDGPRLRLGEIHKHSAAGERLAGTAADVGQMVRTPAYAWLEGFDYSDREIMEDSIYLEYYDRTLTLLWIDEGLA